MLEKLSPYFKVDYYLPRSFISAVKMDYIPKILTTGLIPSDVVLALLYYYLRTTRSMTKDSRDVSYEYLNLHLHNWYLKNCTKVSRDVSYEYLSLPNVVWRLIVFAPFLIKSPKRCLETYWDLPWTSSWCTERKENKNKNKNNNNNNKKRSKNNKSPKLCLGDLNIPVQATFTGKMFYR
jgi:hypothetical protein